MLVIKTRARDFAKLERRVRELHSYEVPEVIALTVDAGSQPYVQWLAESTTPIKTATRSRRRVCT